MAEMKSLTLNGVKYDSFVPNKDRVLGMVRDGVVPEDIGALPQGSFGPLAADVEKLNAVCGVFPEGYTQVEYIESTGTQGIGTQVVPTSEHFRVDLEFEHTVDTPSGFLFGSEVGGVFSLAAYVSEGVIKFCASASQELLPLELAPKARHNLSVEANNGILTVVLDGETHTAEYSGSLEKTGKLYLLAHNKDGSASQRTCARVYSCKIYDNGALVCNLVPALHGVDIVGLYDFVNGRFYFSLALVAGPPVAVLDLAGLKVGGNDVYHAGNKPAPADIGALPLSGGAMTGPIDASGTTNVLDFGTAGWIRGLTANGGRFDIFGYTNPTVLQVGGSFPALALRGKNERPSYNGGDVALLADVNTKAPAYDYGTTDLVPGVSALETGKLYFVYE